MSEYCQNPGAEFIPMYVRVKSNRTEAPRKAPPLVRYTPAAGTGCGAASAAASVCSSNWSRQSL